MSQPETTSAVDAWIEAVLALANIQLSAPEGSHIAIAIAPPSPELAVALLGAASVVERSPGRLKPESFGQSVSYVTGRKFYDSTLGKSKTDGRVVLHAEFNQSKVPEMVARPAALEARTEMPLPEPVFEGIAEHEIIQRAKEFFRRCIRPVIILTTRPTDLVEYTAALNIALDIWPEHEQALRFATSTSMDSWFRSPILVVTPEQTKSRPWLREVEPAAVIALGWKSWRKPARWNWPLVNHFLVLDVRGEDVDFFREFHDGTEGLSQIQWEESPDQKIEPRIFSERVGSPPSDSDWDEELDLD
jgi:hypothetical protein